MLVGARAGASHAPAAGGSCRDAGITACRREAVAQVAAERREQAKDERRCDEQYAQCLTHEREIAAVGGTLYDVYPCSRYKLEPRSGTKGFELRASTAMCSRARAAGSGASNACDYERSDCRMGARVFFEVKTDSAGGACTPVADSNFRDCSAACL